MHREVRWMLCHLSIIIHQRDYIYLVHLDLEDPALLEIAELLDSQAGEKYTLMLLRNGDDLDHASFVQVQMLEEDDAMRWVCNRMHQIT